jgi:hypothetical protein
VILAENPACGEDEGVILIRQLHRRPVIDHIELAKIPELKVCAVKLNKIRGG